jgi:transposase-like protein
MNNRTQCPRCQLAGSHLAASSEGARVDYFRCDRCGHVWTVDKNDPKAKPRDVTVRSAS